MASIPQRLFVDKGSAYDLDHPPESQGKLPTLEAPGSLHSPHSAHPLVALPPLEKWVG